MHASGDARGGGGAPVVYPRPRHASTRQGVEEHPYVFDDLGGSYRGSDQVGVQFQKCERATG